MLAEFLVKLGSTVLYDFGKNVKKTEMYHLAMEKIGVDKHLNDFPERYVEALVELRLERKSKIIMNFFRDESIAQVFYNYYYAKEDTGKRSNDKAFDMNLKKCIETFKVGDDIKLANVDVNEEVRHF
ncbi:MAG: hypothetical protein IPG78_03625 [Ignavibacteria bacterium]|nr:hypothetical protein [Ignavibacteria bacterium]